MRRRILERWFYDRLKNLLVNNTIVSGPKGVKEGGRITESLLTEYTPGQWQQIRRQERQA